MKAEIIAVGTELLLGQILNTNAQYLAEQCAGMGIDIYYQTVVGDNEERIRNALRVAAERADVMICTGGLGPTLDDLTRDALAKHVQAELVMNEAALRKIERFYELRNMVMVESNRRQALTLKGAAPLPNDTGMAVGTALAHDHKLYMLLPGPPKELVPMFERYGKPWLRAAMGEEQPLYSKSLKFAGIGESNLEFALIDLIEAQSDVTIAPYAKEGEVMIRLTTRAASESAAMKKMTVIEQEIRNRVGAHLFAEEDISLDAVIVRMMKNLGMTIAAAESCTGGLFSNMLTSHSGSSDVFAGGVVCYTNEAKKNQLGVPAHLLEGEAAPGAVSPETAAVMAEQIRSRLQSDVGISFTGVAGPNEWEGKPIGLVYVGIAMRGKPTAVQTLRLSGNREMVKLRAARAGFYHVWTSLKEMK